MKPQKLPPYRVNERPCGDFAVQRFANGRIQRFGTYPTRDEAERIARMANLPTPPLPTLAN